MDKKCLLWIRNDLRIQDNCALFKAIDFCQKNNQKLILFFNINPKQIKDGTYSNDYFFSALKVFNKKIKDLGLKIYFQYCDVVQAFKNVLGKFDISDVFLNICERGYGFIRDQQVLTFLRGSSVNIHRFQDHHLIGANQNYNLSHLPYKIFTPYYNSWLKLPKINVYKINLKDLKTVLYKNFTQDNYHKIQTFFKKIKHDFSNICGEDKALNNLDFFVKYNLKNYDISRNFPSLNQTSNLSQYLSSGEISIRTVYHRVVTSQDEKGAKTFIQELCWRDFYNMIYAKNPNQDKKEIKTQYRSLQWENNSKYIKAWKEAKTGVPIVDAAMRQLLETGLMHNRLRMIVSSFLIKDLLVDWKMGEKFFSDYLIDYDSASNIGGWQWSASTGTDAVPYFRIFNPISQSKTYDSQGEFIYKYLPELKNVPVKYIHEPTKMPVKLQQKINCIIGRDYPKPIIDHKEQREKALAMFNVVNNLKN